MLWKQKKYQTKNCKKKERERCPKSLNKKNEKLIFIVCCFYVYYNALLTKTKEPNEKINWKQNNLEETWSSFLFKFYAGIVQKIKCFFSNHCAKVPMRFIGPIEIVIILTHSQFPFLIRSYFMTPVNYYSHMNHFVYYIWLNKILKKKNYIWRTANDSKS